MLSIARFKLTEVQFDVFTYCQNKTIYNPNPKIFQTPSTQTIDNPQQSVKCQEYNKFTAYT